MVVIRLEGGEAMTSLPWSSTTNPAGGLGSGASLEPKTPSPISSKSSSAFTTSTLVKSKPSSLLFFFFFFFFNIFVLLFGPVWGLGAARQRVSLRLRRRVVVEFGIGRASEVANWGSGCEKLKKERFQERDVEEEEYMVWAWLLCVSVFCWERECLFLYVWGLAAEYVKSWIETRYLYLLKYWNPLSSSI